MPVTKRQVNLFKLSSAAQGKQQEVCLMTVDLHPSFAINQSLADRKFIPHDNTPSSWEGVRRGGGNFFKPTV